MSESIPDLTHFGGVARLFPLPNVVLFPNLLQALHIFEPRYRQMTADALAGDRLLAMVLLRPGWENDYDGKPPIHSVACLGKILSEQRLPDGRFNLQLRGLKRVKIVTEIPDLRPYRSARVELIGDTDPVPEDAEAGLRAQLAEQIPIWTVARPHTQEMFSRLLTSELSLATVSDVMAFALPLPVAVKQELLEDAAVHHRVQRLAEYLGAHKPESPEPAIGTSERPFPPDFSAN